LRWFVVGLSGFVLGCSNLANIEEKVLIEDVSSARPPSRPETGPKSFDEEFWFAARKIWLGTSVRETKTWDEEGWREVGWDLDGLSTSYEEADSNQTGHCYSYGSPDVIQDGDDGRDNAIGAGLFQFLGSIDTTGEYMTNDGIRRGASTLMLRLTDVNDWQNDESVGGELYVTSHDLPRGVVPNWNGEDERNVSSFSFVSGTKEPLGVLPNGYIRDGTWVSGEQNVSAIDLVIPVYPGSRAVPVLLRLHGRSGWLTAHLGHGGGGPGTMGFSSTKNEVADTLLPAVAAVMADEDCKGFAEAENFLRQYAEHTDVSQAETWNPNPGMECDSLSWGLDIEWLPTAKAILEPVVEEESLDCSSQ
jgi:hypothetical protein